MSASHPNTEDTAAGINMSEANTSESSTSPQATTSKMNPYFPQFTVPGVFTDATSQLATSQPATSQPATSQPATSQSATSGMFPAPTNPQATISNRTLWGYIPAFNNTASLSSNSQPATSSMAANTFQAAFSGAISQTTPINMTANNMPMVFNHATSQPTTSNMTANTFQTAFSGATSQTTSTNMTANTMPIAFNSTSQPTTPNMAANTMPIVFNHATSQPMMPMQTSTNMPMGFIKEFLVPLDEAKYALNCRGHLLPIHTYSFDQQAEIYLHLTGLLGSNIRDTDKAKDIQRAAYEECNRLETILKAGSVQLYQIGVEHRKECSLLNLGEINDLSRQLKQTGESFLIERDAIIAELNETVGKAQRDEVKQRLEEKYAAHQSLCTSLSAQIGLLKDGSGLPKLYEKRDDRKRHVLCTQSEAKVWYEKVLADLDILNHNIPIMIRVMDRLTKDMQFAKTLATLKAPFNFFGLPRELRDKIYGELLTFADKTTITARIPGTRRVGKIKKPVTSDEILNDPAIRQTIRVKLWIHPLFVTSNRFREEAGQWFYRTNEFGIHHKANFYNEICPVLQPSFHHAIRTLSITLTNFCYGIKVFCSNVQRLEGLRTLNIYACWGKLRWNPKIDRLAMDAFKLLLNHVATPPSMSCFAMKQASAFCEAHARYLRFRSDIDGLDDPEYKFAVMMFIYRRRTRELRKIQNDPEELAIIDVLISVARREVQERKDAKRAKELESSQQEGDLRMPSDETSETKYPIPFEILKNEVFHTEETHKRPFVFYRLHPDLKINVFSCELKPEELILTKSDSSWKQRVLKLKDPADCAEHQMEPDPLSPSSEIADDEVELDVEDLESEIGGPAPWVAEKLMSVSELEYNLDHVNDMTTGAEDDLFAAHET